MAETNSYFKKYHECEELYVQAKYTECTKLALINLMDYTMPRYYLIKTLLLLVGAENDSWDKAEKYRVRAEREYAATKKFLHEPPTSAEEASMRNLRKGLDDMLEYQANEAPPMSFQLAHHPGREGNLMDYLYEREVRKDIAKAERLQEDDAAEELAKELEGIDLDDKGIPLEYDEVLRAAKAGVVGEDVSIPQAPCEIRLEDRKASFGETAQEQQEQKAFI